MHADALARQATQEVLSVGITVTREQKQQYEDQGYFVVKGVLSPEEIARYTKRASEIAHGDIPPGGEKMVVRDVRVAKGKYKPDDPEKGLWKLLQPDHFDPAFADYPTNKNLLDAVEAIIGPDIKCFLTMMIYKPPGLGDVNHPFHQDKSYFNFGPADLIMGTWIALDATTADNGTMLFIPGSHKEDIPHEYDSSENQNFGILYAKGYEPGHPDEVAIELEPGAGVFFHSRLLHRTGPNVTEGHRRVLTMHCASTKCEMEGDLLGQMKMRLVRGQEYAGCI
ncbi:MAG: phytanoyl-CoA dioxygenase family protein [Candidatus Hydrogenedentales bacterium]